MKITSKEIAEIGQIVAHVRYLLPEVTSTVQAGFPSAADEYIDKQLDLNELIVKHPAATFFVKVQGDSMRGAGIHSGDILVVDRSIKPVNGKIVVAIINGEFTVKRLEICSQKVNLNAENPLYPQFVVDSNTDFQIWGVVTYVIHQAK